MTVWLIISTCARTLSGDHVGAYGIPRKAHEYRRRPHGDSAFVVIRRLNRSLPPPGTDSKHPQLAMKSSSTVAPANMYCHITAFFQCESITQQALLETRSVHMGWYSTGDDWSELEGGEEGSGRHREGGTWTFIHGIQRRGAGARGKTSGLQQRSGGRCRGNTSFLGHTCNQPSFAGKKMHPWIDRPSTISLRRRCQLTAHGEFPR